MNTLDEVPEENVFQPEDIDRKVYDILDSMLFNVPYDEAKVHNLQNAICERIMKTLIEGNLNYKYKRGAGYVSSTSNYLDNNDSAVTTQWPKERKKDGQSKHMNCVVTIYAIYF